MMNNSENGTSQAFLSNAGNIVFNNSIINSGSKAHYNFDAYSSKGTEALNITFNNSKLRLTIPEGTHPVKKILFFKIPRILVGMNMKNDNIVFNNSVLKEEDKRTEFSNPKATLEFDYSKVTSNNSVLDIPTIGFDSNGKDDTRTFTPGLEINGASEVTIGKFNKLKNEDPREPDADLEKSFKNIIINGGSVKLPMEEGTNSPKLPIQYVKDGEFYDEIPYRENEKTTQR